jgi:hypothetical protein
MAVAVAWKRLNFPGKYKQVLMKLTYAAGDTTLTCVTGLKQIVEANVSLPSVTAVPVTKVAVAGGTVTITTTNPGGACYLFLEASGR